MIPKTVWLICSKPVVSIRFCGPAVQSPGLPVPILGDSREWSLTHPAPQAPQGSLVLLLHVCLKALGLASLPPRLRPALQVRSHRGGVGDLRSLLGEGVRGPAELGPQGHQNLGLVPCWEGVPILANSPWPPQPVSRKGTNWKKHLFSLVGGARTGKRNRHPGGHWLGQAHTAGSRRAGRK